MNGKFMQKFMSLVENKLMPPMIKLSQQTHMKAVRNGMVVIIPLVIVGSFFLIALNLPFPGYEDWVAPYANTLVIPFRLTVYMMSLYVAFGVGSALGRERGLDSTNAGILAVVAFMMTLIPMTGDLVAKGTEVVATADVLSSGWHLSMVYLGSSGLFGAIVVSLLSVDIFYFMKSKNMVIKMPEQVPASVSDSFAALFPTVVVIGLGFIIFDVLGFNIHSFMNMVMSPFQSFLSGNNLFGALLSVFFIGLLWSVGIHGLSIMGGILRPFWQVALEQNSDAIASGISPVDVPNIITEPFYQWFVWIGGAGATLGLMIAIFLVGKSAMLKEISKIAIVPSIFNINEPVIFGIPIVLNPILMIPFIFAPMVITVISYFAVATNLVIAPYLLAPWTMPGPIGAFLATGDWKAILLVCFNILVVTLIYIPFVKSYDNQLLREEKK